MLISRTTELGPVQLALKFLGVCWWELISCHSQRLVYSLTFVLMRTRVENPASKTRVNIRIEGPEPISQKGTQNTCWRALFDTFASRPNFCFNLKNIWIAPDIRCGSKAVHKLSNRAIQNPSFSLRSFSCLSLILCIKTRWNCIQYCLPLRKIWPNWFQFFFKNRLWPKTDRKKSGKIKCETPKENLWHFWKTGRARGDCLSFASPNI